MLPNAADAVRLVGYGQAFVEAASTLLLGVDISTLSAAHLIRSADVRQHLIEAETALREENFQEAMYESKKAVSAALKMLGKIAPKPDARLSTVADAFENPTERQALKQGLRYLTDYLGELRASIGSASLPIDGEKEARFRRVAPTIVRTGDGRESVNYPATSSAENASFCVGYALEFAEAVERRVP